MSNNKLQSLTEIFNEKFFRIPDFQRGYSWSEEHLEDFWDDLINLKKDSTHYTGLLTIEPVEKQKVVESEAWKDDMWLLEGGSKAYYLIDGQQRLTTSIILINELLNLLDGKKSINFKSKSDWQKKFLFQSVDDQYKSYMFGYEKDNPSDEYFKTKILDQNSSTSDKVPEQTLYTANLQFAKDFFQRKLSPIHKTGRENLEAIFRKVCAKFKYNLYEIDNELDIYVTFETMNNRGKPLSNLELLKNRMIYLSTLLNDDNSKKERLRKDINEAWKTIYAFLGKNKNNPMDDDDFLRNHWIMYFQYNRNESSSYSKFLINRHFTAKRVIKEEIGFNDIKDYIDSLSKSVKSWFHLYNPQYSTYSDETKEWLQKLNRLGMGAFPPLLMASLTKKSCESEFLSLLKSVERFAFLVFKVTHRPSHTKNNHFYRLANSFYSGHEEQLTDVINEIDLTTAGEDDDYYYGSFNLWEFEKNIKTKLTNKKEDGFYGWSGLKYFLYEYELYLQGKAKGDEKISWTDFNKRKMKDTIEHIYPQKATDDCWASEFHQHTTKRQEIILHNLGNLLLLSQSKNSELQNKCFDFKKKHQNKTGDNVGFFNGSYSEIEVSDYKKWTPLEIRDRGLKMLAFLEHRWNIDFKEWDLDKVSFMKLDFLAE